MVSKSVSVLPYLCYHFVAQSYNAWINVSIPISWDFSYIITLWVLF